MKYNKTITTILACLPFLLFSQTYVDQTASGLNNGTSWENAYTNLQTALQNTDLGAEVWIAKGIYFPSDNADPSASFEMKTSISVYGGFFGTESNIEERELEVNKTVLSGDYNQDDLIEVTSDPLTINASNQSENARKIIDGGSATGLIKLNGLVIEGGANSSTGSGAVLTPDGNLEVWIQNCVFKNNYSTGSAGALRFSTGEQEVFIGRIEHTSFVNNRVGGAGGSKGGAIWATGPGLSFIDYTNCLFQQNYCPGRGGAITNDLDVRSNYTNCIFNENRGGTGGATFENVEEEVNYFNCVFYKNTASSQGSAIVNYLDAGNREVNLSNTIFYENGGNPLAGPYPYFISHCILDAASFSVITNSVSGSQDLGNNQFAVDPGFVDVALHDFNLLENSPAINQGDNENTNSIIDFTGYINRIVDDIVDMGALEYHTPIEVELVDELVTCFGAENGSVELMENNYPPFTYQWIGSGYEGNTLENLGSGDYNLTVTNAIGDFKILSFTIDENPEILATVITDLATGGNANGSATITAMGGMTPFSYQWNTNPVQTEPIANDLPAGEYMVTITDANLCELIVPVMIDETSAVQSIDEVSGIDIFPNPFSNQIEIQITDDFFQANNLTQVVLYNSLGQVVLKQSFTDENMIRLNTENLSAGYYLLILDGNENQFRKKIIKG